MASLNKLNRTGGTFYCVQLSAGEDPQKPKISLGQCTLKNARIARGHIETLIRAKTGGDIPRLTHEWLTALPDGLRVRLERLEIVEARAASRWTVGAFIADYIKRRTDVKAGTRRRLRDVERKINVFFRGDNIGDVTVQQAKNFKIYLTTTVGLAENTARRHIGICRQFFNAAVDAEIIRKNPFRGQPVSVRANKERFFYVTLKIARKVLDACPDTQWRLIFGLARFGGLRCPSELLRLKWDDIDWEHERFVVHASKTEHHADGGVRTVPMFPELKPLFQDAYDEAPAGSVYCIEKTRDTGVNLRTHMCRIIKRAGLVPWPKLFQNMRSTRETELFKITGGNIKAVCDWIGNSPEVAMQHYAQVTEADMKEAAKMSVLEEADARVVNRVLPMPESECKSVHDAKEGTDVTPDDFTNLHTPAPSCTNTTDGVHWAGLDSNTNSEGTSDKELSNTPGNARVSNRVVIPEKLPDLNKLWDNLPADIKAEILKHQK